MHNNFYFLRQLTYSLEKTLHVSVVSECFSQNKDELVVRFERIDSPFFIRASLSPSFSCLSFPENFHRARKNSVDLFQNLIGQRVENVQQFENERSFAIRFSNHYSLLFKMHGNRSNIILFQQNSTDEIFKNDIVADANLDLQKLDRPIDWSYEHFVQHQSKPESIYFTFGKVVWRYLRDHYHYESLLTEEKWQSIKRVIAELNDPGFYLQEIDGRITFSLLQIGKTVKEFDEPTKAINEFFFSFSHEDAFSKEKSAAISHLKANIQASENYLDKTLNKLIELETDNNYKTWADLLMANLHSIKPGSERVTLSDFYQEHKLTEIKLKRELSPQKNAAVFYKKSKNQQIEINHLRQLLDARQKEKDAALINLQHIESAEDLKSLRKLIETSEVGLEKEKQSKPLPYREIEFNGYKIWIGKNAQNNDTLTLKYGYKEDLWLHAKDVAGSHVLIKHQSGKNFPKEVIERGAQLAAYYSKRKNESLCPVTVTPRKYVRKRKGDPAGAVVVEREDVLMVEPKK